MFFEKMELCSYLDIDPPFLLLDQIDNLIPGIEASGVKFLDNLDWFFLCHMKKNPVMPGVLQVEALLQTMVMVIYAIDGHRGKMAYVNKVTAQFLDKVAPNSELRTYAKVDSYKRGLVKGGAVAKVLGKEVCKIEVELVVPDFLPTPLRRDMI